MSELRKQDHVRQSVLAPNIAKWKFILREMIFYGNPRHVTGPGIGISKPLGKHTSPASTFCRHQPPYLSLIPDCVTASITRDGVALPSLMSVYIVVLRYAHAVIFGIVRCLLIYHAHCILAARTKMEVSESIGIDCVALEPHKLVTFVAFELRGLWLRSSSSAVEAQPTRKCK